MPRSQLSEVLVADAVRTPIGRYGGGLAEVRPDDLAAAALRGLVNRHPDFDLTLIDDITFGDANGAGEDNRNVARMAGLLAGLPVTVPGSTVNRLCGSGMEAIVAGSRAIAVGDASICIAGGVESMSRAPWVVLKSERGYPNAHGTLWSSTLGWRMVNPAMPDAWTQSLGDGAELLANRYGISRDNQDAFAAKSHGAAAAAWSAGAFDDELVTIPKTELTTDESVRPQTSREALSRLKPAFRPGGTVTAGNSSPLNDGASAVLLADEQGIARLGAQPLARIAARAVSGVEPPFYGIGPVPAAEKALHRAGIGWDDLESVELNEAFAAQSLACLAQWPALDPALVNPAGGALALGHPLGCSGSRILTTLAWRMHRQGMRWGMAAMCIGVGQGIAVILEGLP
jgi:acetyl-CoA acetyltransferase family protein